MLTVVPTTAPTDPQTSETLQRIRELVPANVSVAGLTALTDDLTAQLSETLPVFVFAILAASYVLMTLVFRSVVVPLKAAAMNLLSIGAAYGVTVVVFQWGWFQGLLGLEQTMPVVSPLPVLWFAVLFGLSMDYEVFLLSRIREELRRDRRPNRVRRPRAGGYRSGHHLGRADHDHGVPELRRELFTAGDDDRPRHGNCDHRRRDRRPDDPRPCVDGAARASRLVAPQVARPEPAPRGRRGSVRATAARRDRAPCATAVMTVRRPCCGS